MYDRGGSGHEDDSATPLQEGWQRPRPEHTPQPTYWPIVVALAITFLFWGAVSALAISVVGLVLLVISLAGWIGELRHAK